MADSCPGRKAGSSIPRYRKAGPGPGEALERRLGGRLLVEIGRIEAVEQAGIGEVI